MLPESYDEAPQRVNFKDEYVYITTPVNAQANTDSSGNYSLTLAAGTYSFTTRLAGPWTYITNAAGSSASYSKSVSAPSTNNIDWDTSGQATADIAEMNVFYHVNKIHDYVKNTLKYDNMDLLMLAEVNAVNLDNAYFSSGAWSLTFGDGGGRFRNFALFSDIIYHEYTHAVNRRIYTDGGADLPYEGESGAIDEGVADYYACTINGDSMIGDGGLYLNGIVYMRDLNNTLKIPDDWKGEVHDDGRIIAGVLWDLKKDIGKQLADELIHNARFGCPESFQDYAEQVLIVDDDPLYGGDDDISNGTPHSVSIGKAFIKHGIFSSSLWSSWTLPSEKEYIRGVIEIKAIPHDNYGFENCELYIWEEAIPDKTPENGHLIIASGDEGVDYLWNTSVFKDNIYCLGLKVVTEDNNSAWLYTHDITIDNYNSPSELKDKVNKCVFLGEKIEFPVSAASIDDPDGPFYVAPVIIVKEHTLPTQPYFNFDSSLDSWIFSWMPAESDEGKIYSVTFQLTDGEFIASQTTKICVMKLVKIPVSSSAPSNGHTSAIDGNYIVWAYSDRNSNDYAICLYDISRNEERRITSEPVIHCDPVISGNYIAWEDYRGTDYLSPDHDLYLYDISKDEKQKIASNSGLLFQPKISGNYIVWQEEGSGYDFNIYLYDIFKNEKRQVAPEQSWQVTPDICGNYIVWRSGDFDIYLYDISKNEKRQIASGPNLRGMPVIFGSYVVYQEFQFHNDNWDIYLYDISKNETRQITFATGYQTGAAISGNYITWNDLRNGNYDVYLYDIFKSEEWSIASGPNAQCDPHISGNRIVWLDIPYGINLGHICLAMFPVADTTPPTTPVVKDDGAYTTSTSQLHALWTTSSDSESGITEYQYAIGTSAGGRNIVDWTSTGTNTSVTKTGLSLIYDRTYYFMVRAKNGAGLYSVYGAAEENGSSDGIIVVENAFSFSISSGWNLISLPIKFVPSHTARTLAAEINKQGGQITKVQRWDGSGWKTYVVGAPFGDFAIEERKGYFLLSENAASHSVWLKQK
ncbi:MAG: hypothetical protein V1709_02635 [Planctomycetota bacterium]